MQVARIKLSGRNPQNLSEICNNIKDIAKNFGVSFKGPIPLPTKTLKITTMKTPCGDGTGHGNATYERWEMRVHKRVMDVQADDRALRQIMRVNIPNGVRMSIQLKD